MKIKEDPTVLKSTKIYFKGPVPYRYTLRYAPKQFPAFPYSAHRENMVLVGDTYEMKDRYWSSYNLTLEAAEKEYQKRIDSEGVMGV